VRRQAVELARLQDNQWVIASGLRGGERVATGALQSLQDGMAVRPVEAAAAAPDAGTVPRGRG
jgi:hypothetical protein